MSGYFTPRTPAGKRLKFHQASVRRISGQPFERGRHDGIVEIHGTRYRVLGASCGGGCVCDAIIIPARRARYR